MIWQSLNSISEFEQLLEDSIQSHKTIALFKHSTRCAISSMAKSRLEKSWEKVNPETPIYLLNLIQHRDLSNEVAVRLNISHQSPQLILVKSGKVVYDASHISINAKAAAKHS